MAVNNFSCHYASFICTFYPIYLDTTFEVIPATRNYGWYDNGRRCIWVWYNISLCLYHVICSKLSQARGMVSILPMISRTCSITISIQTLHAKWNSSGHWIGWLSNAFKSVMGPLSWLNKKQNLLNDWLMMVILAIVLFLCFFFLLMGVSIPKLHVFLSLWGLYLSIW